MVGAVPHGELAARRGRGPAEARHAGSGGRAHRSGHARKPRRAQRGAAAHLGSRLRMNAVHRARLAEDFVRRLAAAIRGAQLYAIGHPIVVRNVTALLEALAVMHAWSPSLAIGM